MCGIFQRLGRRRWRVNPGGDCDIATTKAQGEGTGVLRQGHEPQPEGSDWQRIGDVYAEAGENDKAEACFQKALTASPKGDTAQSEIGSWYIRIGQREKGEDLYARALARNPDDMWHCVRAAEAYLGVPRGR